MPSTADDDDGDDDCNDYDDDDNGDADCNSNLVSNQFWKKAAPP